MKPGAKTLTIKGAKTTPKIVNTKVDKPNIPELALTNRLACAVFCSVNSVNTGTKACEKAPSPKIRLKKLGILNATKKESARAPGPNKLAITTSRTKPLTLETRVIRLTIAVDFRSFLDMV